MCDWRGGGGVPDGSFQGPSLPGRSREHALMEGFSVESLSGDSSVLLGQ